ncbi:DUF3566 domain-containing protein [Actinomadura atramentaria]|uniref:DUF3566 domain-containing protein n=1 Tax=Actinomadura atramentaria TaxID=1990 RepID=UPI0003A0BE4A|nr:DUF3566 domain-containing protein [Actinomadura atramentaria]
MSTQPGGENEPVKPSGGKPGPGAARKPASPAGKGGGAGGRSGAAKRNGGASRTGSSGSGSRSRNGSGTGSGGSGGAGTGRGAGKPGPSKPAPKPTVQAAAKPPAKPGPKPGDEPSPSTSSAPSSASEADSAPAVDETAIDLAVPDLTPDAAPPAPRPARDAAVDDDTPNWAKPVDSGGSVSAARTGPQPAVRVDDPPPAPFGGSADSRASGANRMPGFAGAALKDRPVESGASTVPGGPSSASAASGPSAAGKPGSGPAGSTGGKPARKAQLQLARLEPWSVMKFSFMMSLVCFVVLLVAVVVLYMILAGLGVFDAIGSTINDVTKSDNGGGVDAGGWFSFAKIFGYTVLIGALNVLLITALSTVGSVIYNLAADIVGGVEVTLKEAE